MLFDAPFYQLPLLFDAERLQAEALAFEASDWVQHPTGFPGNAALILVSVGGGINDDFALAGPMQPTPLLERAPYLRQVLAALRLPISRTRLMRIAAGGEVPRHRDSGYHWYQRVRLHIPIVTDPAVRFQCGEAEVHMAAGELWAFDHTQPHQVTNPSSVDRIHLVVDVRRDSAFEALLHQGRVPSLAGQASFETPPEQVAYVPQKRTPVRCEPYRFEVLTPSEMRELIATIRDGWHGPADACAATFAVLQQVEMEWAETFGRYGHDREGELAYARWIRLLNDNVSTDALSQAAHDAYRVITSMLSTTNRLWRRQRRTRSVEQKAKAVAIDWHQRYRMTPRAQKTRHRLPATFTQLLETCETASHLHEAWQQVEAQYGLTRPAFQALAQKLLTMRLLESELRLRRLDRPVFIVSAPRAGSTLLFETLAQAPEVWTIGGESHQFLENLPALHPVQNGYRSNRLTAADATSAVVGALRRRLAQQLMDRAGQPLSASSKETIRWLEKTPKNALRIPFMRALFPDARFIYLHRDPAASIASIMAGWRSQQFVTYPNLPGWDTLQWSFLLPEGWEAFTASATVADLAAFQWAAANRQIIHDLAALPTHDWCAVSYADIVNNPQPTIQRLCDFAGFTIDEMFQQRLAAPLPWSRYTLSAPAADKWRMEEAAIAPLLPQLAEIVEDIHALA